MVKVLKENNPSISFSKSYFYQDKVKFLEHYISKEGIQPDTDKITEIKNLKIQLQDDNYLNFWD